MIAASTGATFTAWVALIIIFGGLALWTWHDWRERRRETQRLEMELWAEPSRVNRSHDYHRDDELHEPPMLPDDYRDWST